MGVGELILKVKEYSGFSYSESKDALEMIIESLAVHLPEPERRLFAAQLPTELADLAVSVYANDHNSRQPILEQFIENNRVDEARATKQIYSAWRALKDALGGSQINHIRSQLAPEEMAFLG